mmetsp:Transcript_37720/g.60552  ORF Transcript_37720/g.60552 Transcript_37720/m.60552 type:complete len:273 (+) Transcript_37720:1-819(+)
MESGPPLWPLFLLLSLLLLTTDNKGLRLSPAAISQSACSSPPRIRRAGRVPVPLVDYRRQSFPSSRVIRWRTTQTRTSQDDQGEGVHCINPKLEKPLHRRNPIAKALLMLTACTFKALLGVYNNVKIHNGERLIRAVEGRENGTGLFTVSNHASMLDPAIVASMYPWHRDLDMPHWPPWTLCTDSFFRVHPLIAFWLKSGKAMPITRASPKGMKQKYLRDFFDRLNAGEWCHVYPEGKITQPWRCCFSSSSSSPISFTTNMYLSQFNIFLYV